MYIYNHYIFTGYYKSNEYIKYNYKHDKFEINMQVF